MTLPEPEPTHEAAPARRDTDRAPPTVRPAPTGERIASLETRMEAHEEADRQRHTEVLGRITEIREEGREDQESTRHEIKGIRQLLFAQLAVILILTLGVLGIVGAAVSIEATGIGRVEVGQSPRSPEPGAGSTLDLPTADPLDDTRDVEAVLRAAGDPPVDVDGLAVVGETAATP